MQETNGFRRLFAASASSRVLPSLHLISYCDGKIQHGHRFIEETGEKKRRRRRRRRNNRKRRKRRRKRKRKNSSSNNNNNNDNQQSTNRRLKTIQNPISTTTKDAENKTGRGLLSQLFQAKSSKTQAFWMKAWRCVFAV